MNIEFDLYQKATYLSQEMLAAIATGDIELLTSLAEQREEVLNQIHQRLSNRTSLSAEQVELLKGLLELNEQLVTTICQQRQTIGDQLLTIQVGKKATHSYRQ